MSYNLRSNLTFEAVQVTEAARQDPTNLPQWVKDAWQATPGATNSLWPVQGFKSDGTDQVAVRTIDRGIEVVAWGDWLVLAPDNNIYLFTNYRFTRMFQEAP